MRGGRRGGLGGGGEEAWSGAGGEWGRAPEAGMVRIPAPTTLTPTSQFPFRCPWESPVPRMAEVMTWVVLMGIPIADAVRITPAEEVSAQNPWTGCSFTKSLPTVLMIRPPPIAVPKAIAAAP